MTLLSEIVRFINITYSLPKVMKASKRGHRLVEEIEYDPEDYK